MLSYEEFCDACSVQGHVSWFGEFSHEVIMPDGSPKYIFCCEDNEDALAYAYYQIYLKK